MRFFQCDAFWANFEPFPHLQKEKRISTAQCTSAPPASVTLIAHYIMPSASGGTNFELQAVFYNETKSAAQGKKDEFAARAKREQ